MASEITDNGKNMLRSFAVSQNASYFQGKNLGRVELTPLLDLCEGEVCLEFRIGITTRYIIRSIMEFCSQFQHHAQVKFGARLSFLLDRSAFTEESLPMLDYMMNGYRELQCQKSELLSENQLTRSWPLSPGQFSELLQLYNGKSLGTVGKKNLAVCIGDPRLHIDILRQDDGVCLFSDYFEVYRARDSYAILLDQTLYLTTPEYSRRMEPYLRAASSDLDLGIQICASDWSVFGTSVLPVLQEYCDVTVEEGLIEEFAPKIARVSIMIESGTDAFLECRIETAYENETFNIFDPVKLGESYRDIAAEKKAMQCVYRYFPKINRKKKVFYLDDDDSLYELIEAGFTELESIGEVLVEKNIRSLSVQPSPRIQIGLSLRNDLLELSFLSDDLPLVDLSNLLESYRRKKHYIRLKNGEFLKLENNSLQAVAELLDGLHLRSEQLQGDSIQVPKYRAMYLDHVLNENPEGIVTERSEEFCALTRRIRSFEEASYVLPHQMEKSLRTYQKYGYYWMRTIDAMGFGGILADDMGLGKTIQVIALFCAYRNEETDSGLPSLVICPASLLYNWESEITRFAPDLQKIVISGNMEERKKKIADAVRVPGNILITSYDLMKRDLEQYKEYTFRYQIIDEAQMIKNQMTQSARAVKKIHAVTRFALTGTPIENRLSELWSIFDYLMPGMLGTYTSFQQEFETAIIKEEDPHMAERLRSMIYPFVLRRLKSDVLKELPSKSEITVYAGMEEEQRNLYNASLMHLKGIIAEDDEPNRIQILAELMRLREVCCDPSLVFEDYRGSSAKRDVCLRLLEEAMDGGHKVLVFSQFTSMLDLLAAELEKREIAYYMLTGSVSKEKRLSMVRDFHTNDTSVFLISLKAGGTGLNLTAADIVIHYDPWWNIAAQNQATDRAYRIGQKNKVTVYKLIAKDTIEERILKMQENKDALSRQIITDEMASPVMTPTLLREILE